MRSGSVRCLLRRRDTPKRTFYAELRRKAPSERFHHVPGAERTEHPGGAGSSTGQAPPLHLAERIPCRLNSLLQLGKRILPAGELDDGNRRIERHMSRYTL